MEHFIANTLSNRVRMLGLTLLAVASALLTACGGNNNDNNPPPTPPVASNQFYSMTNTTANSVVHLTRNADGSLALANTTATGGAGSNGVNAAGMPVAADSLTSQYSVVVSPDHKQLFAVNAGNSTVTSFAIDAASGNLTARGAFLTGAFPASLAWSKGYLYVLAQGNTALGTPPQVWVHAVNSDGSLGTGTAVLYAGASLPTEILASPDGANVLVMEKGAGKILSFPVIAGGQLGTPVVTTLTSLAAPFAGSFANSSTLVVADAGNKNLQSFAYANGALTAIGSGVGALPGAPCWLAITPNGAFVYAGLGSGEISSYAVGPAGALTLLNTAAANERLAVAGDSIASADGKFLYSTYLHAGTVITYGINANGTLAKVGNPAIVTSGSTMQGLAGY